jgi:hypothetical protein
MSFDMVWLNTSGEEGGNFLVQIISTCLLSRRKKWGGGRHPTGKVRQVCILPAKTNLKAMFLRHT